jgi:DnaJ-class molecular chaperone
MTRDPNTQGGIESNGFLEEAGQFEALGVSNDASEEMIRDAYRILAKRYHPDLHSHEHQFTRDFGERVMQAVNGARDALLKDRYKNNGQSDNDKATLWQRFGWTATTATTLQAEAAPGVHIQIV